MARILLELTVVNLLLGGVMKTVLTILTVVFLSSFAFAQNGQKDQSTSQKQEKQKSSRQEMAQMHQKMADCLNSNKEMKDVFYRLIQEQIKTQMLAEATPEYAFTTISQPMVPEEKSKPKRSIMVMLGTLLGGVLSVLLTLVLYFTGFYKKELDQ